MLTVLEWDSAFFGLRLARVTGPTLHLASAAEAVSQGRAQRVDCLSLLVPAQDAPSIVAAQAAGFRLVDLRQTLERPAGSVLPPPASTPLVRAQTPADVPALEAIAGQAHRNTRFSRDP
ncbi:MAG TPA: hypothetical protein VFE93_14820, partial [Myxococcaceae bacterium]|nr:hypothetical protein [Myxococcaceae bacterium]